MTHYIAPGRQNLVWHLANVHKAGQNSAFTDAELAVWHAKLHKDMGTDEHQQRLDPTSKRSTKA